MTEFEKLNIELESAGLQTKKFEKNQLLPVEVLVNSSISVKPHIGILVKYLQKLKGIEQELVIRALSQKGIKEVSNELVKLFDINGKLDPSVLWSVGNALNIIDDENSYYQIIEICREKKFGSSRQMLMDTLRKIKTEESFQVLIGCLEDETIRGHAIEALGKSKEKRALKRLQNTGVEKGKFEFKAKGKAITALMQL